MAARTGAQTAHAYAQPGTYTVNVRIRDGKGGEVSGQVQIEINTPGTPPEDPAAPGPLTIAKLSGSVSFKAPGRDACAVSGIIPGLASVPPGTLIRIDVGGATLDFSLDAKGRARNANGTLRLKLPSTRGGRKGTAVSSGIAFAAKLTKGAWADGWADEGLNQPSASKDSRLTMRVQLTISGQLRASSVEVRYTAKAGLGGKFRN